MTSHVYNKHPAASAPPRQVTMTRAAVPPTPDQALWVVIRNSAEALSFENYATFIEPIMGGAPPPRAQGILSRVNAAVRLAFPDAEPYRLLKVATEVFMMASCGVIIDENEAGTIPSTTLEGAVFPGQGSDPAFEDEEQLRLLQPFNATSLAAEWQGYLKTTTNPGVSVETIPYLYNIVAFKLGDVPILQKDAFGARKYYGILQRKLARPCLLELIWNYWLEEGMLVQTTNAMSWRFQNRRGPHDRDPLAMVEIDPLRGLNNLLWGWVQDEEHRLTIARRAYEYDHEYGLKLIGKAVPPIEGADSRSRFLEGLHTLLMLCTVFYKEDDDTTVVADGFPVLNALREVHLQLTQGAHNQYGDLPWTARQEFLMQQWILARPEMREFLPRRVMVDYPEPWMDSVETMKSLQGWTDTSILHFRDMALYGEKILLSVRYGLWTDEIHPESAANWARYWRPEIQGYIFAYRAATGVDLAATTVTGQVNSTVPSVLLRSRLPRPGRAVGARAPQQQLPRAAGGHRGNCRRRRADAEARSGRWRAAPPRDLNASRTVIDLTSSTYLGLRHDSAVVPPWGHLTTGVPAVLAAAPATSPVAARLRRPRRRPRRQLGTVDAARLLGSFRRARRPAGLRRRRHVPDRAVGRGTRALCRGGRPDLPPSRSGRAVPGDGDRRRARPGRADRWAVPGLRRRGAGR